MATTKRHAAVADLATRMAVAAAPLNNRDLQIVEAVLAEVAPQWSVELHGISLDDTTLIVLPEDGEDEQGPSFAISREGYSLRLDQIHWDELTELGTFTDLHAVIDAMATVLAEYADIRLPASITIH